MNKIFSKIGLAKTAVKYAWFCFFALIFFAATFFKQVVWAEDVDISAYSGWCLGNITGVAGGYTYVDLRLDTGIGCPTTGSYSGTVKFNNCDFHYNCGSCSGGSKTCTYTGTYVPSPYACTITPATTKTEPCGGTPPTISDVSTPIAGAIIMATYQPITFSYQDDVKVVSVEIYDGATLLTTMTINEASGSRYYNWYTSTAAEGPHTIKLIAYDDESTPSVAFTRDVVIDFNPPTIVLTSPSASGANIVGPFTISASASDTGSGIKKVEFFLDTNSNQLGSTLTAAPYSYYWDSTATTNGSHKIYAYATDNANRINYTYFDVTVNNPIVALPVGPTVVFTSPALATGAAVANVDNTANLRVNVTAGTSPVANVKFFLNSTTSQLGPTFTAAPYSYDWDTKDTANGNYQIYAVATDTAGLSGSAHIYVNVQNTTTSSGGGGSSTVTCTYTCSDWGVCTAEEKQSCLNFTHTPTTGTCSEPAPTNKTKDCIYTPPLTTGAIIVKNKLVNDGGGTKKVSDFSFTVNGGNAIAFNSGGENDLKKSAGVYTIKVPAVENYVTTYDKCSNIDLAVGQTVTCTVTNTYKAPTVTQVKCDYFCNKWSECSTANIKTCIDIVKTPAGCVDWITTAPADDCQYQAPAQECVFTCSKWGDCTAEGKMWCSSYSHTPVSANCSNKEPNEPKACEYAENNETVNTTDNAAAPEQTADADASGADVDTKSSRPRNNAVKCEYTYSAYGTCVGNKRTRIVLSKKPDNCQEEADLPVLEEDCDSSITELVVRPDDAPVPVPEAVMAVGVAQAQENQQLNNYNGRTSSEWQKYYFGSEICADAAVCGGDADPDNDGLSNNEEYRFGTDPKASDTDGDGRVDGGEIQQRRDPLAVSGTDTGDQMVFEDPKASPASNEGIYKVTNVETAGGERGAKIVKLSGKAIPNAYINVVVFSDPIVMTVKTNEDGSWSYVLDKPLPEGNHQVFVVVTSNTGKIVAKSDSFGFVQTAEAAVAAPVPGATVDRAPAPTKTRAGEGYLLLGLFSFLGLSLAVVAIGLVRGKSKNDQPLP